LLTAKIAGERIEKLSTSQEPENNVRTPEDRLGARDTKNKSPRRPENGKAINPDTRRSTLAPGSPVGLSMHNLVNEPLLPPNAQSATAARAQAVRVLLLADRVRRTARSCAARRE